MSELENLTNTIATVLESDREGRSDTDPANIVDAVFALSRAIKWLGNADAATPMGGLEAHGVAMKESAETIASALMEVATSINGLAVAIETSR